MKKPLSNVAINIEQTEYPDESFEDMIARAEAFNREQELKLEK